jgi:hypothetical protein
MSGQPSTASAQAAPLGRNGLRRILGKLDDAQIIEILRLNPTLADLEQAALWATGNGDVLARSGRPLTGTAAAIVDVLAPEEEEPPPTG